MYHFTAHSLPFSVRCQHRQHFAHTSAAFCKNSRKAETEMSRICCSIYFVYSVWIGRPSSVPQRPIHLTFKWLSSHVRTEIATFCGAVSCIKCVSSQLSDWGTMSSVLKWRTPFFVHLLTLRSSCIMP